MTPDTFAEWTAIRLAAVRQHMPAAFADLDIEPPELHDWCASVVAGRALNVLLEGTIGTGKTGNAWATWPHLVALGWTGSWRATTEQGYLDLLLPGGDRQIAHTLEQADVLLLDDIGGTTVSDWSRGRLFTLLDARWAGGLPTVLTSNLTGKQLTLHLGERTVSRLGHHVLTVTLTGPDRRLR
jgi:DNA replication protein DnaC